MSKASSVCYVPGCGAAIVNTMLMCRECWHQVPRSLRRDVWRTYRAIERSEARVVGKAIAEYRQACAAASEAVEAMRP